MNNTEKKEHSVSSKYRLTSGIYIVIVVLILLVVNLLAGIFNFQFDFTPNKAYSLTGEFRDMLDRVDKDVEIIACQDRIYYDGNQYLTNIAETIENMSEYTDKISCAFKSIDKNPDIAADYPTSGISTTSLIVRLKDNVEKYRIISVNDMFDSETDSAGSTVITESKVEYVLANAVDFVCRDEFPYIYITSNHLETLPGSFISLLSGNNYSTYTLNLLAKEIPEDADYIIIFNPMTDFTDLEIQRLEAFLQNGGELGKNLIVFMSPGQPELPKLERFLTEWGITVGDGYLYNTQYSTTTDYQPMLVAFGDATIAGSLYNSVSILTANTRPLAASFSERDFSATTVLLTSATYTQLAPTAEFDPDSDPQSNDDIMILGTRYAQGVEKNSNVAVVGSYDIVSDAYMVSELGNSSYMMQIIDYLDQDSAKIYIFPKSMETPLLSFSSSNAKTICFIVFAIALPLCVAAVGIVVFFRRRHL